MSSFAITSTPTFNSSISSQQKQERRVRQRGRSEDQRMTRPCMYPSLLLLTLFLSLNLVAASGVMRGVQQKHRLLVPLPDVPSNSAEELNAFLSSLLEDMQALQNRVATLEQELMELQTEPSVYQDPSSKFNLRRPKSTSEQNHPTNQQQQLFSDRLSLLEDKLQCVSTSSNSQDLYFEGCNVHIRDGSGFTSSDSTSSSYKSHKGNLIVGYNEDAVDDDDDENEVPFVCSLQGSQYRDNQALCEQDGGIYGQNLKLGHHNIIIGAGHSYTQHSGLVVGQDNAISAMGASVVSGRRNHALGDHSSILGGADNVVTGNGAVVVGGYDNIASGNDATIVGGSYNAALGEASSIIGGTSHQSSGEASFVGGGSNNKASGILSAITSGHQNHALGKMSSIHGGHDHIVNDELGVFVAGQNTLCIDGKIE